MKSFLTTTLLLLAVAGGAGFAVAPWAMQHYKVRREADQPVRQQAAPLGAAEMRTIEATFRSVTHAQSLGQVPDLRYVLMEIDTGRGQAAAEYAPQALSQGQRVQVPLDGGAALSLAQGLALRLVPSKQSGSFPMVVALAVGADAKNLQPGSFLVWFVKEPEWNRYLLFVRDRKGALVHGKAVSWFAVHQSLACLQRRGGGPREDLEAELAYCVSHTGDEELVAETTMASLRKGIQAIQERGVAKAP